MTTDLLPSLLSIDAAAPNGFSDHVAVTVALVPRSAHPPPVNTWRADLAFLSNTVLRESLERDILLLAHEALARSDSALVSGWHSIKQEFVRRVKHYTTVHREATGTGADEWAAISAVETAVEALASGAGNPAELQRAA
jgi:hypothetical protein